VQKNYAAVDSAVHQLQEVAVPVQPTVGWDSPRRRHDSDAPPFVLDVIRPIIQGAGDDLPVSALPVDGTYPSGTTRWEKRNIAQQVPVWDPQLCSQCGKCYFVCPHAAIRVKVYDRECLTDAPSYFKHTDPIGKEFFKDK